MTTYPSCRWNLVVRTLTTSYDLRLTCDAFVCFIVRRHRADTYLFRMNNRHGHQVCWVSRGGKNTRVPVQQFSFPYDIMPYLHVCVVCAPPPPRAAYTWILNPLRSPRWRPKPMGFLTGIAHSPKQCYTDTKNMLCTDPQFHSSVPSGSAEGNKDERWRRLHQRPNEANTSS